MAQSNKSILEFIQSIDSNAISEERKETLNVLVQFISDKIKRKESIQLNFICTHNSRRSQFSQVWAKVMAYHFDVDVHTFSGGVEVTSFNPRVIASLKRVGFSIESPEGENPHYQIAYSEKAEPLIGFSKLFDHQDNPSENFAAVMTCSHADENCPFIPGAEARIPLNYSDPKKFDNTDNEKQGYDERSKQIAQEMHYVFKNVAKA